MPSINKLQTKFNKKQKTLRNFKPQLKLNHKEPNPQNREPKILLNSLIVPKRLLMNLQPNMKLPKNTYKHFLVQQPLVMIKLKFYQLQPLKQLNNYRYKHNLLQKIMKMPIKPTLMLNNMPKILQNGQKKPHKQLKKHKHLLARLSSI